MAPLGERDASYDERVRPRFMPPGHRIRQGIWPGEPISPGHFLFAGNANAGTWAGTRTMTVEGRTSLVRRICAGRGIGHATTPLALVSVVLLMMATGVLQALWAQDEADNHGPKFSAEAAAIFNRRCTACHTYGKGIKVGPDLKGVTERRKHDWLVKFIHASSSVIKS